ncbi:MAG TPA: hypothetical protein VIU39_13295 [Anaerolineales bacterium]
MSQRPLLIEFMGLPGAGKTTLAQFVLEELTAAGYRCFALNRLDEPEPIEKRKGGLTSKLRTAGGVLVSTLRYRLIAGSAWAYTRQIRPFNLNSFRRYFVLLTRLDLLRRLMRGPYDILLLDQGLLQSIWSLSATGEPPRDDCQLETLLQAIHAELSPLIVGVHVGADLAVERVTTRPTRRSRFDTIPASQASSLLRRQKDVISRILSLSAGLQEASCLDVNGSRPPDQNVRLIVPFIQKARPVVHRMTQVTTG